MLIVQVESAGFLGSETGTVGHEVEQVMHNVMHSRCLPYLTPISQRRVA